MRMVDSSTYRKATTHETSFVFIEVQRYRRVWMWVLLGLAFGTLAVIAVAQWADMPLVEAYRLSLPSLFLLGMMILLLAVVVYQAHLIAKIDDHGIRFRLFPFQWFYQHIKWRDVEEVYIREYDAIVEYGGWGVKYGQPGKSYTISGRFGIQLVLADDRRILIGTHRPIELEQLILRLLYDYELK